VGSGVFCGSVITATSYCNIAAQEKVFYVGSVPRLYHEVQRDKSVAPEAVLRRQLEEKQVGVRWPPACEDVKPNVTQQCSEAMTGNTTLCVIVIHKL
jgi:hypothetical protein